MNRSLLFATRAHLNASPQIKPHCLPRREWVAAPELKHWFGQKVMGLITMMESTKTSGLLLKACQLNLILLTTMVILSQVPTSICACQPAFCLELDLQWHQLKPMDLISSRHK